MDRKHVTLGFVLCMTAAVALGGCSSSARMDESKVASGSMPAGDAANMPSAPGGGVGGQSMAAAKVSAPGIAYRSSPMKAGNMAANLNAGSESPRLTLASLSESQTDRYLIKNANITIESSDVREAAQKAKDAVKGSQGYVSNSHESTDGLGQKNVTVELRVPCSQFDASVSRILALGRVLDNTVTSDDVSEEFVDTDAKLRNLKKTELRLLDHLARTGVLHDTLEVETELTRVRQQIEELEGKLRFMAHRISYSTLTLTFKEPAHAQPIAPTESYSVGQVTSEAARAFIGFLQNITSVLIWLSIWSVVWAPCLWLARKAYLKLKQPKPGTPLHTNGDPAAI